MKPATGNADEVLKMLLDTLMTEIEEISPVDPNNDFNMGQFYIYRGCLETLKYWQDAEKYGLTDNLLKKYNFPLVVKGEA